MPFSSNLYEKCPFLKSIPTSMIIFYLIQCKLKIIYFFDKKMWKKKCNGKEETKDVLG